MPKLTDLAVRNAKPKLDEETGELVRNEISDNGGAMRLVVQPSGHKSYATRVWFDGKQIKIVHGDTAALSLADARSLSAEAIRQAKQGKDPRKAKRDAKVKRQAEQANTFAAMVTQYLNQPKILKRRTLNHIRDRLLRLACPALGSMPVSDVKRSDVVRALDHIERTSGPIQANRVLSDIRCVLDYAADRIGDDWQPPRLKKLTRDEVVRDRILTDDEIRAVWNTGNAFCKFLLLTGCRRDEAGAMRWDELQGDIWTLPAARNKAGVDLARPLSKRALEVLETRPRTGDYVFGNTGMKPLRTYGRLKASVDAASGVKNWRFHDARRSSRTLLSRAGISPDHAERCLGHVIPGIRGVYDKHEFIDEKRHAFKALAQLIDRIVNPPKGGVSDINEARKRRRA
jgi:integrase